jgi:nucleoside-diphosphate-sugar epimerase
VRILVIGGTGFIGPFLVRRLEFNLHRFDYAAEDAAA